MPRFTAVRLHHLVVLPVSLALAIGTIGVGAAAAEPAGTTTAPAPAVPKLNWTACEDNFDPDIVCANATVPLDYARPAGPAITIALAKLPAGDPARRIGSLFINPGGPGGSGVNEVQWARETYSDQVRARFDIVGFDPRFVGASRPLATCASDEEVTELLGEVPQFPITRAEEHLTYRAYERYSGLCAERSPFLAYGATANVARDMDLLRQAVGDRKLNYVGYSYGSILGQTYAALFPNRIRSLTIDGVPDNQEWSTGSPADSRRLPFTTRVDGAPGAYGALRQFTALCDRAGPEACPFTEDGNARVKYDRLAARLRNEPLTVPNLGTVTYQVLVSSTRGVLFSPLDWQSFAAELQALYTAAFSPKTAAAKVGASIGAHGGALAKALSQGPVNAPRWAAPKNVAAPVVAQPLDSGLAALGSVACSDTINPRSERAWSAAGAADDRRAPYFGRLWTWVGVSCATWELPGKGRYLGPYNRPTSAPVLVIGNRYDPSTPYSGAQAAANRIPGARLLTVDGYGHTTLSAPSACARAVFDAYVIAGKLPARGAVCNQDIAPFEPF